MDCSSMAGSTSGPWAILRKDLELLTRDAAHNGWTAHMFLYQNQMRNLGLKKILQGTPQQLDHFVTYPCDVITSYYCVLHFMFFYTHCHCSRLADPPEIKI